MGKVVPPLVERRISTLAAFMGAPAVPATFQVTVWEPNQVTFELGAVMTKGPAFEETVTCMSELFTPPPPARLSRAVTRKCNVRLVLGNISPAVEVLFRISESFGNVREAEETGLKERNNGLLPLSGVVRVMAAPRSRCSQQ